MPTAADDLGLRIWAVNISAWPLHKSSKAALQPLVERLFAREAPAQRSANVQKVMRYVREVDRTRALAALLLPRVMLLMLGQTLGLGSRTAWEDLVFERSQAGRPFLASPELPVKIDFNISHDSDWVVMSFHVPSTGTSQPQPPLRSGIDVMLLHLPHYEDSSASFLETMSETMTPGEVAWVRSGLGKDADAGGDEALYRLYDLWTYKEAFTKNIGLGLGFDFKRVEVQLWKCGQRGQRTSPQAVSMLRSDNSTRDSDATLDGDKYRYVFTELLLPNEAASRPATPPMSQLVACSGPVECADPRLGAIPQVSPPLQVKEAQASGILTTWTFNDLVDKALSICAASPQRAE